MGRSYELLDVDKLTLGTVGEPGRRVFLLQARHADQVVTLKVEKAQVAALAAHLVQLLEDLPEPDGLPEDLELETPAEPEWVVGTLGSSWDDELDRLLLLVEEAVPEGAESEAAEARIGLTRAQMAALALRGAQLVTAGRPPCPLCSYPLDPRGHQCPRTNGHRPPAL